MAETKYGKNFVFTPSPDQVGHPEGSADFTHMFNLGDDVIKGSNITWGVWFREPMPVSQTYKPHFHDYDEIIGYFGSNPDDPFDLGGEMELWIEDEQHIFNRSCLLYIPKGIRHNPWFIRRVDRPVFVFWALNGSKHMPTYFVDDPKWSHLPMLPAGAPSDQAPPLVSMEEYRARRPGSC
jgi:hypothetical protein